jgi:AcrR family transcriptional regulator
MLERAFAAARNVLIQAQARASASGGGPDTLLREGIRGYMDFLVARPSFVRLIEWETLSGGRSLGDVPAHIMGLQEALAVAQTELARGVFRPVDPAHMLISIMGLCWFPLAHAATLLRSLGLDPHDPVFIEARKRHVIDLVLHGIAVRQ